MQATLNLSNGFGQYGESINFKQSTFPGGEVCIKVHVPQGINSCRINSRCNSSNDLLTIIMAIDALRREGVDDIELFIPYFPYSRQDRICELGESFSLKVICKILESLNLNRIITYDIHSNVAGILLENLTVYNNHREVRDFIDYLDIAKSNLVLLCPDQGAIKKTQILGQGYPDYFNTIVYCNKTRRQGRVYVDEIIGDIKGRDCIVIDDICDGGATFIELGRRLVEAEARDLYLFVSHGIFSKGTVELQKYYRKISITNSISTTNSISDDAWLTLNTKSFKLNY